MARDTSPTDRRGYDRPAIGDDWADAWDGLVEDIDKISVERGPIADRPSTGEYDDSLYLATDQRILWRWDAGTSDWEAVSGLGTASDPVPGTSHFKSVNTEEVTIDTQNTGGGNTLTTSRTSSPSSLTVQPFSIELFPESGSDRSHFLACNSGDFNNFGFVKWEVQQNFALVKAAQKGTGTAPTSLFYQNFPGGIRYESATSTPIKQKTITSGSIDASDANYVQVTGENGNADDLEQITGGNDGQMLMIRGTNDHDITCVDVSNATLSGDELSLSNTSNKVLDETRDMLTLIYDADVSSGMWIQIAFSSRV